MPTISDPNVVRAIAREYVANGHNKPQALIAAGYKPSYANSGKGTGLYLKESVMKAIAGYEQDIRVDSEMTVGKVQDMYQVAYDLAQETRQSSSMVSAVTGIARLYGMDKDSAANNLDQPNPLTEDEQKQLLELSARVTGLNLVPSKPLEPDAGDNTGQSAPKVG